ncbi:MAG TPA: tRNA uridine-5-carboxymethylaminomethyl(34) synthesis GTPase MnmE [Vicinamibacterales bacterium]
MSFSSSDTIVAIATPPGRGGIGVVRVSGPRAVEVVGGLIDHAGPLEPRRAVFTRLNAANSVRDQIIVTSFPAPHSYTGDDVVELSAHGSPVILRAIVEAAMSLGARLAEPGEFTLRAFLNGRMDLVQAEAVADLIDAVTPEQARLAFDQLEGTSTRAIADLEKTLFDLVARLEASVDFPDEGYHFIQTADLTAGLDQLIERMTSLLADSRRGRLVREGLQVAIVGRPNVGKSSLFNALVGTERAIVTDVPGTTRDLVSEVVDIYGLKVTLVDTAGLRQTSDPIEAEGVARSRQAEQVADLVLVVVDEDEPERPGTKHFVVQSKADLGRPERGIRVSAATGEGLDDLRLAMTAALDVEPLRDRPQITNVRHAALLERAVTALSRAREATAAETAVPEEFVLADLQDARHALEEMTGRRAPEDLLAHIFSRFCVGK